MADRSPHFGAAIELDLELDYPLFWAKNPSEAREFRVALIDQNLLALVDGKLKVTYAGLQHLEKARISGIRPSQAFVAMWFDKDLQIAYESGFCPGIQGAGYRPYRVDLDPRADKIDDRIMTEIPASGLVVVDVTGNRPSVLFEAGLAMGLGKPIVWTVREDHVDDLPFDTRQFPHVVWRDPLDLRSKLHLRIEQQVGRGSAPATSMIP